MKRYLLILTTMLVTFNLAAQIPTVASLVATGTGIKWYTTSTGGTALDTSTPLVNAQHYWASQTIYGVESTSRFEVTATVTPCVTAPAVTTSAATNIGATITTLNGNITAINGANATVRGFKYSTTDGFNPANTGSNISESGSYGTGTFSLSPSNLTSTTTYFVVAYSTNSAGTTYGTQETFTTVVYTVWTLTNASATGRTGPTQAQVNTAYSGTSLQGGVTINTQGIQEWTVPATGTYRIRALGAQGARSGGLGADITGTFSLSQGEIVQIVVGQAGVNGTSSGTMGGGGGGGSFVIRSPYNNASSILEIAGGGGGYTNDGLTTTMNAFSAESGGSTYLSGGGTSGNGGNSGIANGGAAGGSGFLSDGTSGTEGDVFSGGGKSFINGANGGNEGHTLSLNGGDGGFGGGGGGWHNTLNRSGGGGGYSGGQGGTWSGQQSGGGGGSYNSGSNPSNTAGSNSGNGQVIITKL